MGYNLDKEFLYIGHRGTRENYDENTFGAFLRALECGANYIEFDIHKTKDKKLIIIHDSSLNRTTDGKGLVQYLTSREIKSFRTRKNNERIPFLEDVVSKLQGKIRFMIELKGENLVKSLINVLNSEAILKECVISGRKISELKKIKNEKSGIKICYNITKGIGLTLKDFLTLGIRTRLPFKFDMISLKSNLISQEFIEVCHKNNILALSWNFLHYENPLEKIKSLIKMGIDGILFDDVRNIPIVKKWKNK